MTVKKQFQNFDHLLSHSDLPVLVDFYATWCGPCQMMSPILQQVQTQMGQQIQVVKIDSDQYPQLASQYQVQSLPTLILFKNRQPVDRVEGVIPADALIQRLTTLLSEKSQRL